MTERSDELGGRGSGHRVSALDSETRKGVVNNFRTLARKFKYLEMSVILNF